MRKTKTAKHHVARFVAVFAAGGLAALAMSMAGCVGYGTYPKPRGVYASTNPNIGPFEGIAAEGVRWAILEYQLVPLESPEQPAAALSVPPRVSRETWLTIAERAGPYCVALGEPGSEGLPVLAITEARVRGRKAELDLFRPVLEIAGDEAGSASGEVVYQMVTIELEGGFERWFVQRATPWAVGAFEVPPFFRIPPAPIPDSDFEDGEG